MYCLVCDHHQNCLTFAIQGLLKRSALLDITLVAEGQQIKVHKLILAAFSPYFESLFSDNCNWNSIVMKNVRFEDLKLIIEFIYVGEVVVPSKQLKSFLHTAKSLQVNGFNILYEQNDDSESEYEPAIKENLERDGNELLDGRNPLERHDTLHNDLNNVYSESGNDNADTDFGIASECLSSPYDFEINKHLKSKKHYGELKDVIVSNIPNQDAYNKRKTIADDTISVLDPMDPLHVIQEEVVIGDHEAGGDDMRRYEDWDRVKDFANHYFNDNLLEGSYESSHRMRSHDSRVSSCVRKVGKYGEDAFLKLDRAGIEENVHNSSADDIQILREFIDGEGRRPDKNYRNGAGAGESSDRTLFYSSSKPGSSNKKSSRIVKEEKLFDMKEDKELLYCQYCSDTFSFKSELIIHERIHTGEIPFTCHHCGKQFCRMEALILHLRIHSGQKPFKCLHCGEQFSQKNTLVTHLKNHLGDKFFKCEVCGEQFLQKATLLRHQLVHQEKKLYSCVVCDRTFAHRRYLTLHLRTHFER